MGIKIHNYPTESTTFNSEDYYDIDAYISPGVYESKKQKGNVFLNQFSRGLFAQTGNSTPVTATTTAATIIDGGVGTLTVPAGAFKVGDSFRVDMGGLITAKNNDTLTITLRSGAVILATSPAMIMPTISTPQVWHMAVNFTVRAIGATGTAELVTLAQFHILKVASGTQEGFAWNQVNNTTFSTTTSNTLDIQAQWSSNSALNSIYSDICILNKIY
jgi:hypothetical protein